MMSNFFQSHIWRDLQHIFGRESFDFVFQEKSYWGVMRNHKVGPLSFSWYQGLGIHIDETRDVEVDIKVLRDDLSQRFGKSGDIFFQL